MNDTNYVYSHFVKITYAGTNTSVSVFPNPAIQNLTLDINSAENDLVSIEIIDALGKNLRLNDVYINKGLNSLSLNVSALKNGMYSINIANNSMVTSQQTA